MKRIILFIFLYLGLLPYINESGLQLSGPASAHSQDVQGKLIAFLSAQHPTYRINPVSHSCGCGVSVFNPDNNETTYIYASPSWIAAHPEFTSFAYGGPTTPEPGTIDDHNEFVYSEGFINFLLDVAAFEQRMEAYSQLTSQYWNESSVGYEPLPSVGDPTSCKIEPQFGPAVMEANVPPNNIANASAIACNNAFLLRNRRIIHFTPEQRARITKFHFDGSTLVAIEDQSGELYYHAVDAEYYYIIETCNGNEPKNSATAVSKVYTGYKFINFHRLKRDAGNYLTYTYLDQNSQVWINVPYADPDYCIEAPAATVEMPTAGKIVMGANRNGVMYCETLTAEDATLTTVVRRNNPYRLHSVNLDHFVNVPSWVENFFFKLGIYPSDCTVNYVNQRLDELHASSVYTSEANEDVKKRMEYETLGYDLAFGMLYCASDEAAAKDKSAFVQFGLGILHEAIATVDIKEIVTGVAQLAKGVIMAVPQNLRAVIDASKDIIIEQAAMGNINYELIARKLIEANNNQLAGIYNKTVTIANYFKETYFTKCDADPVYGNICPYRHGQVTMMALPIVLTAGEWVIVKATSLINKYVIKTQRAIQLLDEAANASRQITQEAYTLLDDAEAAVSAEKTVIRENGAVQTTIKQEGEVGHESLVITQAANYIDDALLSGLSAELPTTSGYISKSKFTSNAHKIDPQVDPILKGHADDIIANGDLTGAKTETLQNYLFENKMGLTRLDGKVGSNNGFDGLFIKGSATNPEKIFITECKQQWNAGVTLAPENANTGLFAQMSDDWIQNVVERLRNAGKIEQANLIEGNHAIIEKIVITVNKSTGDINLLKLGNY
ncbi:hypothetical protein [Filimonas effusa]|uniref:Uncharacterized protein n=1 Tax=Filimonas effusa TaxID=2508721 RepID=A0A4Q1DBA1_9BACT|nr:hypothetical protein [Filimonas effusa]RXK86055.1 hypothetical protein ESB13_04390 [Filimonas effusa]